MLKSLERLLKSSLTAVLRILFRPRPVAISPTEMFQKILVLRQHNQLGDMLCVVPLLRALRDKYPSAFIALMASPVNYEVMLNNRYLDEVISFDKRQFLGKRVLRLGRILAFIRKLRGYRFDLVIAPATVSTSFTTDFVAYLTGARVRIGPRRIDGVINKSAFWYTTGVDLDWRSTPHRHQTLRNLDITNSLGLRSVLLSSEVTLTPTESQEGRSLVEEARVGKRLAVAYHPGAGKQPNRWPGKSFAELANALSTEFSSATLITAGPMDDGPVQEMVSTLEGRYQLIANKSIRAVASVLASVDLVVSNDTGIMHVAGAVGTPVLSLFGPTDPSQWAPVGDRHRYLVGREGDIATISVGDVLEQARKMLTTNTGAQSGA